MSTTKTTKTIAAEIIEHIGNPADYRDPSYMWDAIVALPGYDYDTTELLRESDRFQMSAFVADGIAFSWCASDNAWSWVDAADAIYE